MNRFEFLADLAVRNFVAWLSPIVRDERRFSHRWQSPRWGVRSFGSLWDAYTSFDWPFSVTLPGESEHRSGRSFDENVAVLDRLSATLRTSATHPPLGPRSASCAPPPNTA